MLYVHCAPVGRTAKTQRIEIRVSGEERSLEETAAGALGQTLSEFVRQAARARAEEVMQERTRIVLDDGAAARFLEALDEDSPPPGGLRELFERPSVLDA